MPNLPWPAHEDEPATGAPSLAALLAWAELAAGSAPEMNPVAEVLTALTAVATDDELAGETAALAAYRNRGGVPRPAIRARRRGRRRLFPILSARRAATVAAAAVLSISAFATAAYTQALPAPVQQLAHVIIGAPAAAGGPGTGPSPAGSGTTGPGATGSNGGSGRAGRTPTGKAHPSPTPHASGQPTPQGSAKPSTEPTPQDSGTPTPTPTQSKGKPSTHPTPHCNGNGNGNGNGNNCTPTAQP